MRYALGVDIGGTSIKCSFVSESGEMVSRFSFGVDRKAPQNAIFDELVEAIENQLPFFGKDFVGIGVGCPGGINPEKGTCDYATNLGWKDFPIAPMLEKHFEKPCFIENDANAALLGEIYFGVAKNYKNVVFLTLGTGVGSGLYLNGHIFSGNEGKGAELGHTSIELNGRLCGCGRRGCLECYASASALTKDAAWAMAHHPESKMWDYCKTPERMNGAIVFEAEKQGDETAKEVVREYISYLGEGCLNFCNAFRPEAIILGGGVARQGEYLRSKVQDYLDRNRYGLLRVNPPKTKVLISALGSDAGIYGAAALCFEGLKQGQR